MRGVSSAGFRTTWAEGRRMGVDDRGKAARGVSSAGFRTTCKEEEARGERVEGV